MTKQKGICEECRIEYEYEYNPKFPRKYCPACSAAKKKAYEALQGVTDMQNSTAHAPETFPVEKPGVISRPDLVVNPNVPVGMIPVKAGDFKKPSNAYPKDPVGLAVEIFNQMIGEGLSNRHELMDVSIKLVKQAQEAFS